MSQQAPKTRKIGIAIVEHHDQFLIGQRPEGASLAGYWEFPGGKVEEGEFPDQAAVRECLEETGMWVRVVKEYPSYVHDYGHVKLMLQFFHCELLEDPPEPRTPFRWGPRETLRDYTFPDGNRAVLDLLLS